MRYELLQSLNTLQRHRLQVERHWDHVLLAEPTRARSPGSLLIDLQHQTYPRLFSSEPIAIHHKQSTRQSGSWTPFMAFPFFRVDKSCSRKQQRSVAGPPYEVLQLQVRGAPCILEKEILFYLSHVRDHVTHAMIALMRGEWLLASASPPLCCCFKPIVYLFVAYSFAGE